MELDAEEAEALQPARNRSQRLQAKSLEERAKLESTITELQDIINEAATTLR